MMVFFVFVSAWIQHRFEAKLQTPLYRFFSEIRPGFEINLLHMTYFIMEKCLSL